MVKSKESQIEALKFRFSVEKIAMFGIFITKLYLSLPYLSKVTLPFTLNLAEKCIFNRRKVLQFGACNYYIFNSLSFVQAKNMFTEMSKDCLFIIFYETLNFPCFFLSKCSFLQWPLWNFIRAQESLFEQFYTREVFIWFLWHRLYLDKVCNSRGLP